MAPSEVLFGGVLLRVSAAALSLPDASGRLGDSAASPAVLVASGTTGGDAGPVNLLAEGFLVIRRVVTGGAAAAVPRGPSRRPRSVSVVTTVVLVMVAEPPGPVLAGELRGLSLTGELLDLPEATPGGVASFLTSASHALSILDVDSTLDRGVADSRRSEGLLSMACEKRGADPRRGGTCCCCCCWAAALSLIIGSATVRVCPCLRRSSMKAL